MKKNFKVFCCCVPLLFAVAIGVACQLPVPANEAKFGDMSFRFPKDMEITKLEVIKTGTRSFTLKADSWKSINSPPVIAASAEGQALIIKATGDVASQVTQTAIAAAAKGAKP